MTALYDTSANGSQASGTSFSFNITVGSNTNRVLMVLVGVNSNVTVTVQVDGTTITQVGTSGYDANSGMSQIWGQINVATGTRAVQISFDTDPGEAVAGAISVYQADQVAGWASFVSEISNNAAPSLAPSSTTSDFAVDELYGCYSLSSGQVTPNGSQSQLWQAFFGSGPSSGSGSSLPGAAGSTTMAWTLNSAVNYTHVACIVKGSTALPVFDWVQPTEQPVMGKSEIVMYST